MRNPIVSSAYRAEVPHTLRYFENQSLMSMRAKSGILPLSDAPSNTRACRSTMEEHDGFDEQNGCEVASE